MKYGKNARIKWAAGVGSVMLLVVPGLALAQQLQNTPTVPSKSLPSQAQAAPGNELISGVILKVEKLVGSQTLGAGTSALARIRLTINANTVWRDWVRDQAQVRDEGPPAKDADRG